MECAYSRYARYATYVSDSRLIPHIVCNPLQSDPDNRKNILFVLMSVLENPLETLSFKL